jgi:pimeloyl-ACP methyl ester carboxylesterase
LLNGFGVGFFHWERNILALSESTGSSIFAMDYLGQGDSWPTDCDDGNALSEQGLKYSIDSWIKQTEEFLEQVVLPESNYESCMLVGNSLGGLIATVIASRRPDLVCRLALVNPTPLWGGSLPCWDGALPAPYFPKTIGRFMFDQIRDPANIRNMLVETYANSSTLGELPDKIRNVTENSPGGHAAFTSILWGRPATIAKEGHGGQGGGDFYDALARVACEVLLVYGAEDPWCGPSFGRAAMRTLVGRASIADAESAESTDRKATSIGGQTYIELSPCGHCPHHEAPEAFNKVLGDWLANRSLPLGDRITGVDITQAEGFSSRSLWEDILVSQLR